MHFAFLTIPSAGEFNVQLATVEELVALGHRVTFLSGESFQKHVSRFKAKIKNSLSEKKASLVDFISLGSQHSVEDFTPTVQKRIHEMRQAPGEVISLQTCIEIAMVDPQEHAATANQIVDVLSHIDPDLIVVDVLSPAMITGVRLSGRKFLLTIPCSPGMTAHQGLFEPHPMAGDRRGSWPTLIESTYLKTRALVYCALRPDMRAKRALLNDTFKLKSFGMTNDLSLLPPYWEDPNCLGGVHFNTFALTDCLKQPESIVFVGGGVQEEHQSSEGQHETADQRFLGQALVDGCDVVYINLGSMFIWTAAEFQDMVSALQSVHDATEGKTRFIFKINKPVQGTAEDEKIISHSLQPGVMPSYIHLTTWIDSQQYVYRHPATKAFVHHGGGNSFNEAVYFAIPQLVLSQWLDTHEYASLTERFGLGLKSSAPPLIQAGDVRQKMLELLDPVRWKEYKSNASVWSLRSKLGGGPKAAAQFIECHALNQVREARVDSKVAIESKGNDMESKIDMESEIDMESKIDFRGYSFPQRVMKGLDLCLQVSAGSEGPITVISN